MNIITLDAGNNEVKVATAEGVFSFNSFLGEARDRRLESQYEDEMIGVYNGMPFFAGELAQYESEFPRNSMGLSKAHEDAKLRILIALHRYSKHYDNHIVVGQPIESHKSEEKLRIKAMLAKEHRLVLNGVERKFYIHNTEVAPEGAAAYWSLQEELPVVHIVDVGSGTVNIATIRDGQFIDKESFTLPFGAESTKTKDMQAMSYGIISALNRFNRQDSYRIVGGAAEKVKPYLQMQFPDCKVIHPLVKVGTKVMSVHPKYATVVGMYHIAKAVYGYEG
ncbi:ParM/StbA family protein [Ectobacillus antri]|uniref:ParM/StbA family protein n=1 Tax=Ectobacillus antri TaxID=2486280 RepID=UPI000F5ABFF1|nr:ParM/StbA family protein [Ectobacillus antri]